MGTHGRGVMPLLVGTTGHFLLIFGGLNIELEDRIFTANRDWDPVYLRYIFSQDFYEFRDLWASNVCDKDLVGVAECTETSPYSPIVKDISLDDATLCDAVEQIEKE